MAGPDEQAIYSIGAVARMLEVAPSTLRGWEKRYQVVAPGRSKGAQRLYSANQVEKLRFVKANLDSGASPADAHRMLASRVSELSQARPAAEPPDVLLGGAPVPLHAHYPTFYSTDESRMRMSLPFLRDGLRLGQPCFLAATGAVAERYTAALPEGAGLTVVDGPGQSVEGALAFWDRTMWQAMEAGAGVIRVVGEMACERELFSSDAEMMRYELAYNRIARRFPVVSLCQYDVREFRGEIVFEAFKAHPDVYDQQVGVFLS